MKRLFFLLLLLTSFMASAAPVYQSTINWQNITIAPQTGTFAVTFELTPKQAGMDGFVGISQGPASTFSNMACSVRVFTNNRFEAYQGSISDYAAQNTVPYIPGEPYLVVMTVNVPAKTYSVTVNGQTIAQNYAFRSSQASVSQLANLTMKHQSGSFSLNDLASGPVGTPPLNDNLANATVIGAYGGVIVKTAMNTNATFEAGEAAYQELFPARKSVWYQIVAPSGSTVTISTQGSSFDTIMSIYRQTGTGTAGLVAFDGDDDSDVDGDGDDELQTRLSFVAVAQQNYFVAVDGFSANSGFVRFSASVDWREPVYEKVFSFTEALANDVAGNANKGQLSQAALIQGTDGNFYGTTRQGGRNVQGTVFKMTPSGVMSTMIEFIAGHGGEIVGIRGQYPAGLVQGTDGSLYGITGSGGTNNRGVIFKLGLDGKSSTVLEFGKTNPSGGPSGSETAGLTIGTNGNLYGVHMGYYNDPDVGCIYRLNSNGTLTILAEFTGNGANNKGANPRASLIEGTDGNFYGTTEKGGANNLGTVFKMTPEGAITTLVQFSGTGTSFQGSLPQGRLVQAVDGNLYGTTQEGGARNHGTIFRVSPTGTNFATVVEFDQYGAVNRGKTPRAGLIEGLDGKLYGTTALGGDIDSGTIFRLTPGGPLETLKNLVGSSGYYPQGELLLAADGMIYGTTGFGGSEGSGTVFRLTSSGEFTKMVNFRRNGTTSIGSSLEAPLALGKDGLLYGTTKYGATDGEGSIFKVDSSGQMTTVNELGNHWSFYNHPVHLDTGLLPASDGNFYGTSDVYTPDGHTDSTVFKMTQDGTVSTVLSFPEWTIQGEVVEGGDGSLYISSPNGGTTGKGAIFKVSPSGTYTMVFEFSDSSAGTWGTRPSPLVLASDGYVYGCTQQGGANLSGVIFRIDASGSIAVFSHLNRSQFTSGEVSFAGVVRATDGNFYGTSSYGGQDNHGMIFRITPAGVVSTHVQFTGNGSTNKGSGPLGGLTLGPDGAIYGTTTGGGSGGCGTVFRFTTGGNLRTLAEFDLSSDHIPKARLQLGGDGNLYGTCAFPAGSVYRLLFPGRTLISPAGVTVNSETSAFVRSKVTVRGTSTNVELEYGTDPNLLGSPITVGYNIGGYRTKLVGTTLENLLPATIYYYRFRAKMGSVVELTPIQSFSTLTKPTAEVTPATLVTASSARLNGIVNARNYATTAKFEWGSDENNFPNILDGHSDPLTGGGDHEISAPIPEGLESGLTYFYRIVATNAGGTTVSGTQSFTTLSEPGAITMGTGFVSAQQAKVLGIVTPKGFPASVSFDYRLKAASGQPTNPLESKSAGTISGSDPQDVEAILTLPSENQGKIYEYRLVARVTAGTTVLLAEGEWREFTLSIVSGLEQRLPIAVPPPTGELTVSLSPPGVGAWRLAGEVQWRPSGQTVTGLASGKRLIEFLPVPGQVHPPGESVEVLSGGSPVLLEAEYLYVADPPAGTGALQVTLEPAAVRQSQAPARWRVLGLGTASSVWRLSGQTCPGLVPGTHLIEFEDYEGRVTPKPAEWQVTAGITDLPSFHYDLRPMDQSQQVQAVQVSELSQATLPFSWVGQIRGSGGTSTGFAVKAGVVATAGHVVFDDATLSMASDLQWLHQRHAGVIEPVPQDVRGCFVATGYEASRQEEGVEPGEATDRSRHYDYAALWFVNEFAARLGFSGFLASEGATNGFLTTSSEKILAGYATDIDNPADRGKLHATRFTEPIPNFALTQFSGTIDGVPYGTYTTTAVSGRAGCSGGPLFVRYSNGKFYPAGIYLGGTGQTFVRGIDRNVASLFDLAETRSYGGGNNNDGGKSLTVTPLASATQRGALTVVLHPANLQGAGWMLLPGSTLRPSGYVRERLRKNNYQVWIAPVAGYLTPPIKTVAVANGSIFSLPYTYEPDLADTDLDGVSNYDEMLAGTNPNSPADYFRVQSVSRGPGGFSVTIPAKRERVYTLQRRDEITGNWNPAAPSAGPFATDNPALVLTDPNPPGARALYRVSVALPQN